MMKAALVLILAYLLGSIPFGYLIVRHHSGGDVRKTGSGGTGATNVSRRAGKKAGVLTLLLDALKGATAVLLAKWILGFESNAESASWWVAGAAIAALLGHIFPVWLGFRGGKGVATAIGTFLVLDPIAIGLAGLIFVLIVAATRYVSLGSILGAASLPFLIWLQHQVAPVQDVGPLLLAAILGAALIVFAHRGNLDRLISGTESKFR